MDYLTNLYALLCPATADRLYGMNVAAVNLGHKKLPFKVHCIREGFETIWPQGGTTVHRVQMVDIKGYAYPRMNSDSVEGRTKTPLGEEVSPFANLRDYVYYTAYCRNSQHAAATDKGFAELAATSSQDAPQQVFSIEGRWVPDLRFCGVKTGEMVDAKQIATDITIHGKTYKAYEQEQTCRIRNSRREHDGRLVTLSLACKGEGARYSQTTEIAFLAPDKVSITGDTWFRCSQRPIARAYQSPAYASSTAALLARWHKLNDECRGGTRHSSCDPRNSVGDQLEKRGCKYLAGPRDTYTCK